MLVACVAAQESAPTKTGPMVAVTTNVVVKVSEPWTDTGVDVLSLDVPVRITADGVVDVGLASGKLVTPQGDVACKGTYGTPFSTPGLPCWALVGRVGSGGKPFFVGRSKTIQPSELGRIYLGVNDETFWFGDNKGAWTATITVVAPSTGVPAPSAVLASNAARAAIRRSFGDAKSGSTLGTRLDSDDDWKIRAPEREKPLPVGVVELAAGLPGPNERTWDDTDAAVRQGLDAIETLAAPEYGRVAKRFLIDVMIESLVEVTPLLPPVELRALDAALERAASEGLSSDVQEVLRSGRNPTLVVAASAKPAATIRLAGPEDLVVLRYRSTDDGVHVYDVYATWTEATGAATAPTAYGDVRIENGRQGFARQQVSVTVDDAGVIAVRPAVSKAHFATAAQDLWARGELAALK